MLPASVVPVRVFQNQNLLEMGGSQSFLRRISGMMKPEAVSRIGDEWHAATNMGALGSILRCIVKAQNIDGYGEIYYMMQMVESKADEAILRSFTRTTLMQPVNTANTLARSSPVV